MKTIETSILQIGYKELNPSGKQVVVLLHGWPDSYLGWMDVGKTLASSGYRVIIPSLRGFLPTRFKLADTPRIGQLAALGCDLLEFLEAMKLRKSVIVGHDWGARAAANAVGINSEIASHLVLLSVGYGTNNRTASITIKQAQSYWYQWLFATELGSEIVNFRRNELVREIWESWSPTGWYSDKQLNEVFTAIDNEDWPPITLHSYQHRWGNAPGDPNYADIDSILATPPKLSIPTLMLHGEVDGATLPSSSADKEHFFLGSYVRKVLPGIGHFPQRENPDLIAQEILTFIHRY